MAVSFRDDVSLSAAEVKQSALYLDQLIIPDPVYAVSEWTRERMRHPSDSGLAPRRELADAVRSMRELAALVRLGRVRFLPTSRAHEPPIEIPLLASDDFFASQVPDHLRAWFAARLRIRKVEQDNQYTRFVLSRGPDDSTKAINVDFGQRGRQSTYDYMRIVKITGDRRLVAINAPPADAASMANWLTQSANQAAAAYLHSVIDDADTAHGLGCSLLTACEVTGDLLGTCDAASADAGSQAVLRLELPMVANASVDQLAQMITEEPAALESLRLELRLAGERLAVIGNAEERRLKAVEITEQLAREQVSEVERKLLEVRHGRGGDIKLAGASLAAGAFGLWATGGPWSAFVAAALGGYAIVKKASRDLMAYKALPGYFLWKLKQPSK